MSTATLSERLEAIEAGYEYCLAYAAQGRTEDSGTPIRETLERMHAAGEARLLERDEYVGLVCDFLERLPAEMVIQRLSGDAPPDYLIAPQWCLDKQGLLRAIDAELERRDSWQGKGAGRAATAGSESTAGLSRQRYPLA